MLRVLLSGAAGSGKGTVARMLQKEFDGFSYFSAGDLIREHINKGTGIWLTLYVSRNGFFRFWSTRSSFS